MDIDPLVPYGGLVSPYTSSKSIYPANTDEAKDEALVPCASSGLQFHMGFDVPPPPNPSAARVRLDGGTTTCGNVLLGGMDVFTLTPVTALKLLCGGIQALVRITGDVPPTPPPEVEIQPHMRGMQQEKENIVRSNSYKNLASLLPTPSYSYPGAEIDGVSLRKTTPPLASPEPAEPHIIVGDNAEPLNVQHSAITRKFYSKKAPSISLEDYLMRLHKFLPMSTAVYLATSLYIHRLAVDQRAIPVTTRNSHRLLLAGLRVAMKALEDQSYAHARFASVGGVSTTELARLEISFCFLTNFEFKTSKESLLEHANSLKEIVARQGAMNFVPRMSFKKRPNNVQETVKEVTAGA